MKDRKFGTIQSDMPYIAVDEAHIAHLHWTEAEAAALDDDGIIDGQAVGSSEDVVVTTFLAQPPCARTLKATVAGTAGNVKAVAITVEGTDMSGHKLIEELPKFTVDTTGSVTGSKAFKTIEKVTIPKMDGSVTIDLGWTGSLGIPFALDTAPFAFATLDGSLEATNPTITKNATDVTKNLVTLNSSLNGKAVDVMIVI